jgi:hypothetical protein
MTSHDSAYETIYAEMPMSKLDCLPQNNAGWDPGKDLS